MINTMDYKYILIGIGIWLFFSCQNEKRKILDSNPTPFPNILVEYKIDCSDSVLIDKPFYLGFWSLNSNNCIFLSYNLGTNFVNIYSYPDFKLLYEGGVIGKGPGEYLVVNYGYSNNQSEYLIYDIMNSRLEVFNSTAPQEPQDVYKLSQHDGLCKPYTKIRKVNDTNFILKTDYNDKTVLELIDFNEGKCISTEENLLNKVRKENIPYTPFDFDYVYLDDCLLIYYYYINRMEYYSIENGQFVLMCVYGINDDQSTIKDYDMLKYYTLDVAINNNLVYCLRSEAGNEYGNLIEVYDMNGNGVAKIILDKMIYSVKFDENHILWGYVPQENSTVLYKFTDVSFPIHNVDSLN